MTLPRLLAKALTSASSPAERRLFNPRTILQSSLYSTIPKPTRPYSRKQSNKSEPSISALNPPPPPPPPPPREFSKPSVLSGQAKKADNTNIECPRPSEIPWQAKVANSVNLIGYVAKPVQFQTNSDGKSWAGTILTQDKLASAPLWIPIIFEGDLAHIAACHLKENDFVHIAGQLTGDPPQITTEQGQISIKVMVSSLSFVQETLQRKESPTSYKQKEQVTSSSSEKDSITTEHLWTDLLANPHDWWDNRLNKSNPTGADFKHKESGELWIDDSTPGWIVPKLESLNFIRKTELKNEKSVNEVKYDPESSWRDLVENPNQWWDNRKDKLDGKVSPKFPDFKSKDGGVPLWLNRVPGWARSKLELKYDDAVNKTSQPNDNKDTPWQSLLKNPNKWWDNRSKKTNPKAPDFRHKETGEALWLSSSPAWVLPQLPKI